MFYPSDVQKNTFHYINVISTSCGLLMLQYSYKAAGTPTVRRKDTIIRNNQAAELQQGDIYLSISLICCEKKCDLTQMTSRL